MARPKGRFFMLLALAGALLVASGGADAGEETELQRNRTGGHGRLGSKASKVAKSKTKIDAKTHAAVVRAVNRAWASMPRHKRVQLTHKFWGLYQVLKDQSPSPHSAPLVADPLPKKPCKDCGKFRAIPGDPCKGLRAQYKALADDAILKGLIGNALTDLRAQLANLKFYGGVASLVGDIVSTAFTVATGGAGGSVAKAAMKKLGSIAAGEVQGAIVDAIADSLPPPLDSAVSGELTEASLNALIAAINKAIKDANAKKNAKMAELQACLKNYNQMRKNIKEQNSNVQACREANPAYCI